MGTARHGLGAWTCHAGILPLQGCDSPPSTIKIGVARPLTGNLAPLGQHLLNGVALAVKKINKEGFKVIGHPVTLEVVAVDDRANAETGKKVAHQLRDTGVLLVGRFRQCDWMSGRKNS